MSAGSPRSGWAREAQSPGLTLSVLNGRRRLCGRSRARVDAVNWESGNRAEGQCARPRHDMSMSAWVDHPVGESRLTARYTPQSRGLQAIRDGTADGPTLAVEGKATLHRLFGE